MNRNNQVSVGMRARTDSQPPAVLAGGAITFFAVTAVRSGTKGVVRVSGAGRGDQLRAQRDNAHFLGGRGLEVLVDLGGNRPRLVLVVLRLGVSSGRFRAVLRTRHPLEQLLVARCLRRPWRLQYHSLNNLSGRHGFVPVVWFVSFGKQVRPGLWST